MTTWPTVELETLLEGGSLSYGVVQPGRDSPGGVPIVRVADLVNDRIRSEGMLRVDPAISAKHARTVLRGGELLLSVVGSVGETAVVPSSLAGCNVARAIAVLRVLPEVGASWVRLALSTESARAQISAALNTTVQPTLNLADARRLVIPLPDSSTRGAIAEVLGALDDKIAANDEVLRVSDQLVRAVFDSLDDASTADVPLSVVAENVRIQVDPAEVDPSTPYVGLEHVPRRSMWMSDIGVAGSVSSAKARFRTGDVLFGKLRPYFHKVVRADRDGIASTDILVVRAKDPVLAGFVLAAASSDVAIRATSAAVEGTRMPRTKWADLAAVTVPWPGEAAAIEFSSQVAVLSDQAAALQRESRVLAETRDELLPLLMSGKIRVRDAEKRVEEVV